MEKLLTILSVDTAASFLDVNFDVINHIATASVLVKFPYRYPSEVIVEFGPYDIDSDSTEREFSLVYKLLKKIKNADEIHIDISLDGIEGSAITEEKIENARISQKGKEILKGNLRTIKAWSTRLKSVCNAPVLLIGKKSIAVRIAELTAGASAVYFAINHAISTDKELLIGLPRRSTILIRTKDRTFNLCASTIDKVFLNANEEITISLKSLNPTELDVYGFYPKSLRISRKIALSEFPNPKLPNFRVLRIEPMA